jgi:hypothetical protein
MYQVLRLIVVIWTFYAPVVMPTNDDNPKNYSGTCCTRFSGVLDIFEKIKVSRVSFVFKKNSYMYHVLQFIFTHIQYQKNSYMILVHICTSSYFKHIHKSSQFKGSFYD